ncbi:MAG: amidophosphoribosyltransferase [Spirochaetes bacterium GWD1_27_9]|nr:MAG: amidophosphoribosyltransferase [Spirochaetes bacterium GWB1_27_13]OHD42447.1 MAG: amidophosphoribosyltransferase [Spirochaetes bacterium GWD1_27_9]
MFDELKEECGVFGISLKKDYSELAKDLYLGLFALQHRGQESCGIAYYKDNSIGVVKSLGLVSGDFFEILPRNIESSSGIGHVRYSTCGGAGIVNAQPLSFKCNKGEIAIAHNGNIPNYEYMRDELIKKGSIFQTTSDSEILIHFMAKIQDKNFEDSLMEALSNLEGAYSMLMLHDDTVIAFRDPTGFRPLSYGEIENGIIFSSETNALDLLGAKNIKDVNPGEIIFCKKGSIRSKKFSNPKKLNQCVFELIYFARPDSTVFGESVYEARLKMGAKLATLRKCNPDIVISVPDSGNTAALGFSRASGIPFEFGLMRNHYMGRTFIKPEQKKRNESVRIKLNPVKSAINGKSLAVVDDSLVRGTTSRKIVAMLKESGAKEVHLFLSSPEIKFACYFGIDTPTDKELISSRATPEEIAKEIGADSVTFLTVNDLKECLSEPEKYCYSCFNGNYPMTIKSRCSDCVC